MGFKRLRDTPLADRLFNVLDISRTGSIEERELGKVIAEIVGDRNTALMCKLFLKFRYFQGVRQ